MLEAFISPNPQALDAVDQDEEIDSVVRRFFKVFAASHAAVSEGVGFRLENFFWRVWNMHRSRKSITREQIMVQFAAILEGGDIRTTPRGSATTTPRLNPHEKLPVLYQQLNLSGKDINFDVTEDVDLIPTVRINILEPDTQIPNDDESITPKPLSPGVSRRLSPAKTAVADPGSRHAALTADL